jgi:hypothetical protein
MQFGGAIVDGKLGPKRSAFVIPLRIVTHCDVFILRLYVRINSLYNNALLHTSDYRRLQFCRLFGELQQDCLRALAYS